MVDPIHRSDVPMDLRFTFLVLTTIFVWCAIPLSPSTVDSDFWGHVQYGMDTIDHGLARTATYTFTAAGHPWINHENLCEIVFALIIRHLGNPFILWLKCAMGCTVIGLIMWNCRRQAVGVAVTGLTAVLLAVNLSFYWGMRPQVFSFTFFSVMIFLHEVMLDGERLRSLRPRQKVLIAGLYMLLFAIWANTHGGFVAGLSVFLPLVGLRAVREAIDPARDKRAIAYLLLLGAVSAAATVANSDGLRLHIWLFQSLSIPNPEVAEWRPPDLLSSDFLKTWLVLAAATGGWLLSSRPKKWEQIVVFACVAYQAFSHQRHVPFLAIIFAFWLPPHLDAGLTKLLKLSQFDARLWIGSRPRPITITALLGMCLIFSVQVGKRLRQIPVLTSRYPVAAVQFMADNEIYGRMVVTGEWSQYVLNVVGARTERDRGCRVAFDGRHRTCFPQTVMDMHFDFFHKQRGPGERYRSPDSPPPDPKRVLEFNSPDLVLLKPSEEYALSTLRQSNEWELLYADATANLWRRKGTFPTVYPRLTSQTGVATAWVPYPAAPCHANTTRNVKLTDND
jgi:hypothetical protein